MAEVKAFTPRFHDASGLPAVPPRPPDKCRPIRRRRRLVGDQRAQRMGVRSSDSQRVHDHLYARTRWFLTQPDGVLYDIDVSSSREGRTRPRDHLRHHHVAKLPFRDRQRPADGRLGTVRSRQHRTAGLAGPRHSRRQRSAAAFLRIGKTISVGFAMEACNANGVGSRFRVTTNRVVFRSAKVRAFAERKTTRIQLPVLRAEAGIVQEVQSHDLATRSPVCRCRADCH
jgi:hypothetical protein